MASRSTPPFFQLGRRVTFKLHHGNTTAEVTGEVMDTDPGWIAVKADDTELTEWYNLEYIVAIRILPQQASTAEG